MVNDSANRLVRVETTMVGLSEKVVRLEILAEENRDDFGKVDSKLDVISNSVGDMKVNLTKVEAGLGWMKKLLIIALVAALGGSSGIELLKVVMSEGAVPTAVAASPSAPDQSK